MGKEEAEKRSKGTLSMEQLAKMIRVILVANWEKETSVMNKKEDNRCLMEQCLHDDF